jgi:hypothetical protein
MSVLAKRELLVHVAPRYRVARHGQRSVILQHHPAIPFAAESSDMDMSIAALANCEPPLPSGSVGHTAAAFHAGDRPYLGG